MSPSPEKLEEIIERPLEKGDILVLDVRTTSYSGFTKEYEIVDPNATFRQRKYLFSKQWVESPGIKTRRRTPYGLVFLTTTFKKDDDRWTNIVKREDRTDLPKE